MKLKHTKFFLFLSLLVVMLCVLSLTTFAAGSETATETGYHKMPGYTEYSVSAEGLPDNSTVILGCYKGSKIVFVAPQSYVTGGILYFNIPDSVEYDTVKIFSIEKISTMSFSGQAEILSAPDELVTINELVISNASELIRNSAVSDGVVTLEYYETKTSYNTTSLSFAAANKVTLYVNNVKIGTLDTATAVEQFEYLESGVYSNVTLWDTDKDGAYDEIYIVDYVYGIVEEIDTEYECILTTDGSVYELSKEDTKDGFVYTIHKNGEVVGIDALETGDLLNIVIGDLSADVSRASFVEIFVTNHVIDSKVSSAGWLGQNVYEINSVDYYVAPGAMCVSLQPGDTGKFYITIDGYIYDVLFENTMRENYAFIMDVGDNPGAFGTTWEIKLLDKNGNVRVMPVQSTLYVTIGDTKRQYNGAALDAEMDRIENLALNTYEASDAFGGETTREDAVAAISSTFAERLITFKEDNGEITELAFSSPEAGYRDFNVRELQGAYSDKTGYLDGIELTEKTVFFNIPINNAIHEVQTGFGSCYELDHDMIQLCDQNSLVSGNVYSGYLYNIDVNNAAGAVMLTCELGFSGNKNALAVIADMRIGFNKEGNLAMLLRIWQGGEYKSLAVSDTYIGFDFYDASVGDVFQYTTDMNGEIKNAEIIYDYANQTLVTTGDSNNISYAVGLVTRNTNKVISIAYDSGTYDYAWDLPAGCTNILCNPYRMGMVNGYRPYSGTSYLTAYRTDTAGKFTTDPYIAVLRMEDGVVVDVVAYQYNHTELESWRDTEVEFIASVNGGI